jgi:biopolymer transport protein TolR
MQLGGRATGRGSRRRSYRAMSEINVTPFVDVMLVLLIVFMVTAPLMTVGVAVDLPKASAPNLATEKDPLYVSVKPDGRIFVQETAVELAGIGPLLMAVTNNNPEARVLVRGDRTNTYERMLQVLGAVSNAGFKKIGLAAEPLGGAAAGKPAPRGNTVHR